MVEEIPQVQHPINHVTFSAEASLGKGIEARNNHPKIQGKNLHQSHSPTKNATSLQGSNKKKSATFEELRITSPRNKENIEDQWNYNLL